MSVVVEICDLSVTVAELVSLWVVTSVPVHLSARSITNGGVRFGQSVGATLTGGIVYGTVLVGAVVFLGAIIGESGQVSDAALSLAFVAWLFVFRFSLPVGWRGAAGMSVVSLVVFLALNAALAYALGLALPTLFEFPL
ncbi:MAG: hypothetical protein ABSF83_08815 [Nitrososphaerales archaeon]|jgi:hypothetical protein